jgi:hypothetical protein
MRTDMNPTEVAARVAPEIDRIRLDLLVAARPTLIELTSRAGLTQGTAQLVGMLRNLGPDRLVSVDEIRALQRYQPTDEVTAALEAGLDAGVFTAPFSDKIALTTTGVALVTEMLNLYDTLTAQVWAGEADRVAVLLPIVERVVDAAAANHGPAFSVVWPLWRLPDEPAALLLAELLTPLRYHRFDAHVAAWTAAGLTVEQVVALVPGDQRDEIEAETDRRAAVPYEVLQPDERATLLTELEQLPG